MYKFQLKFETQTNQQFNRERERKKERKEIPISQLVIIHARLVSISNPPPFAGIIRRNNRSDYLATMVRFNVANI